MIRYTVHLVYYLHEVELVDRDHLYQLLPGFEKLEKEYVGQSQRKNVSHGLAI